MVRFLVGVEKTLEDLLNAKRMKSANNSKTAGGMCFLSVCSLVMIIAAILEPNKPFKRRRHIHNMEIVHRKTIYGMYTEPHIFIKVVLRDPGDIVKIAAVLDVSHRLFTWLS